MRNCGCNNDYSTMEMRNSNNQKNNLADLYMDYNSNNNYYNNNNVFPNNYLFGHAYTPNQIMRKTFSHEVGLKHGTIFPELVSPYCPGQSMDFINYLRTNRGMGGM